MSYMQGAIPRQCWRDPGTAELDATDGKRAQRQHVPAPGAPETSAELRLMDPTSAPCSERRFTEKVWFAIAVLRTHVIRGYRKLRGTLLPRCRVVLASCLTSIQMPSLPTHSSAGNFPHNSKRFFQLSVARSY